MDFPSPLVAVSAAWDAFWTSWVRQHLPQPLLGLLAGCNGVIALLLGLLPAAPLDRQFVLHPLEGLFDNLLLAATRWIASSLASRSWASLVWRSRIVA